MFHKLLHRTVLIRVEDSILFLPGFLTLESILYYNCTYIVISVSMIGIRKKADIGISSNIDKLLIMRTLYVKKDDAIFCFRKN
jgi:hypothetical protein